jgi:hypothetical protein
MKRWLPIVMLFSLFLFAGCDAMLNVNAFSFAQTKVDATKLAGMSTAELADSAESQKFYTALANDASAKASVVSNLNGTLASPSASSNEKAQAAVVLAAVELETTAAGGLINNVVAAVTNESFMKTIENMTSSTTPPTAADVKAFIDGIVPPEATGDQAAFVAMIIALADADAAFTAYGTQLNAGASTQTIGDYNPGAVAQAAVVSAIMGAIDVTGATTSQQKADALWSLYTGASTPAITVNQNSSVMQIINNAAGASSTPLGMVVSSSGIDFAGLFG